MGRAEEIYDAIVEGGYGAVERFIEDAASEELFLDFKRSADHGSGSKLHTKDQANFEKVISGFGNSEGGVVVWGIECKPNHRTGDVASEAFPIQQVTRFRSLLEGAVSRSTIPPHGAVQSHAISDNEGSGFAVTLIPSSENAPHQTTKDKKYYMRAGSSFEPVPHAILAGMFGRRPQPNLAYSYRLKSVERLPRQAEGRSKNGVGIDFTHMVQNKGPGIAKHVFVNFLTENLPGPNCGFAIGMPDKDLWITHRVDTQKLQVISRDGVRLPPDAELSPFNVRLNLVPPFDFQHLVLSCTYGSSGGQTRRFEITRTAERIRSAVEEHCQGLEANLSAGGLLGPIDLLFDPRDEIRVYL